MPEETTKIGLQQLSKAQKWASERKHRSDMWVKFGWKGDMTTIIFFKMVSGDFKTKRTLFLEM